MTLKPYYQDEFITLFCGDALTILPQLERNVAQTCVTSPPYFGLRKYLPDGHADTDKEIGSEPTPAEFVQAMVEVFDGVRRVLRKDGTLFLNLGDSYAGSWGNYGGENRGHGTQREIGTGSAVKDQEKRSGLFKPATANAEGFKPKDLMLIPHTVAAALRDDGWWLRQAFPWIKGNSMPESVTDRAGNSLEYIFHLAASQKYFCDMEAVRQVQAATSCASLAQDVANQAGSTRANGGAKSNGNMKAVGHVPGNKTHRGATAYENGDEHHRTKSGLVAYAQKQRDRSIPTNRNGEGGHLDVTPAGSRNFRNSDLWFQSLERPHGIVSTDDEIVGLNVNPQGYKDAHFATFPKRLVEPLIKMGSRENDIVLDPFAGAGTTLIVAKLLGRRSIGIELNPEYCDLIVRRIKKETIVAPDDRGMIESRTNVDVVLPLFG